MMKKSLVIGVSGLNASGKTTVCEYFQSKGFVPLSLSDAIRRELKNQGKDETRANLIDTGNHLRNHYGPGILAKRTVEGLQLTGEKRTNYVIDSVRHPCEVDELRNGVKEKGGQFALIAIEAPSDVRFERLKSRGRIGDDMNFDRFMEVEKLELNNPDPNGQHVGKVLGMAAIKLDNSRDIDTFERAVKDLDSKLEEWFAADK